MAFNYQELEKKIRTQFPEEVLGWKVFRDQHSLIIRRAAVLEVLRFLRDDTSASFEMLTDVTCVDNLKLPEEMEAEVEERFTVFYQLTSLKHSARLRVKAFVSEDVCEVDSVSSIWAAAEWGEREAYDMYGMVFLGHPDLRRILMPDNYEGHPLRKDYPLKGRGERDNFPKYTEIPIQS